MYGSRYVCNMIQIKPIDANELDTLRQLAVDIYRTTFERHNSKENMERYLAQAFNLEQLAREWAEPRSVYLGAYDQQRLMAYLRLRENCEVNGYLGENHVELQRLYVQTTYQGSGVANQMMEAALDYARQKKYDWLWLGVWEKNEKAQRFYQRWGFEKFSEHVFWMGNDAQTDWLMKKRIQ